MADVLTPNALLDSFRAYVVAEPRFSTDEKAQDGVIRNLEIIGEASEKLTSRFPKFTPQYPETVRPTFYDPR